MKWLLFSLLLSVPLLARAAVSDEATACFEWFGTLGSPDVKNAPWVEVTRASPGGQRALLMQGFLLEENEQDLIVLPPGLHPSKLPKTQEPLEWEQKPFSQVAAEYLAGMKNEPRDAVLRSISGQDFRLGAKARALAMAHACWIKGETEKAQAIFAAAKDLPPWNIGDAAADQPETMRDAAARELAHSATWWAVLDFGGEEWTFTNRPALIPRAELLARFQKIEKNFPNNPHASLVRTTIATLKQMIAEDVKHPPLTRAAIAKLPVEEQAREWIFQLRDQNGRQFSQPGSCSVFGLPFEEDGATPAHELVKIGYPAIPPLLEALGDERLSRSVEFGRDFFFSHRVLTVAECAQQVINRIARRNLGLTRSDDDNMRREGLARYRQTADDWWREFQARGEAPSLVEIIAQGDQDPRAAIDRLRKIAPNAVEDAVIAGAKNSRGNLLYTEALGQINTPQARGCLNEFLAQGDTFRVRADAARQLWKQDDPRAIPAMIAEWKKVPSDQKNEPDWGYQALMQMLIVSGEPDAMKALADGWQKRVVQQRFDIVQMLGDNLVTPENHRTIWGKAVKASPETIALAEQIFRQALEDTEVCQNRGGGWGDYSVQNPRLCDFSVFALNQAFPGRYTFTPKAGGDQRESERQKALAELNRRVP